MTRIAALMPTRNRAHCAARAVETFLKALRSCPGFTLACLCIADDSDDFRERALLRQQFARLSAEFDARIEIAPRADAISPATRTVPLGGPGAARNRALRHLRACRPAHDLLVMFDDDVCFGPSEYGGERLSCDGNRLLAEALALASAGKTIAGCDYLGRQDLSILEHLRLGADGVKASGAIPPAMSRADVACVAPGEISTAFLVIAANATEVPDFVEHYNEDYLWLLGFARRGWSLLRTSERLIHAPPGQVAISATALSFQVFGEIIWLMALEADRYPRGNLDAVGAAVEEIVSDLRAAQITEPPAALERIVAEVLAHYEAMLLDLSRHHVSLSVAALLAAIDEAFAHLGETPLGLGQSERLGRCSPIPPRVLRLGEGSLTRNAG